jgi:hypothetical protein
MLCQKNHANFVKKCLILGQNEKLLKFNFNMSPFYEKSQHLVWLGSKEKSPSRGCGPKQEKLQHVPVRIIVHNQNQLSVFVLL